MASRRRAHARSPSTPAGTINDIRHVVELAHAVGAWVYVDAVHYTGAFSRDIAEAIFVRLVDTGALDCGEP